MDARIPQIEVIDDELATWLRRLEPTNKFEIMGLLNCKVRRILAAEAKQTHPDWDKDQIQREVARRF